MTTQPDSDVVCEMLRDIHNEVNRQIMCGDINHETMMLVSLQLTALNTTKGDISGSPQYTITTYVSTIEWCGKNNRNLMSGGTFMKPAMDKFHLQNDREYIINKLLLELDDASGS
jgi:phage gp29-like protein